MDGRVAADIDLIRSPPAAAASARCVTGDATTGER